MKFEVEKSIEILRNTPAVVSTMVSGLSEEWTTSSEDQNDWGVFDIVGHYIHGEKTDWIPRARIILAQEGEVKFETFDRVAQFNDSGGKTLDELLREFQLLRQNNLRALEEMNLSESELGLIGTHPELGPVTLKQLISTWAVHDLTHIRQISIVLAKHYSENVGPWREYLTILR